ncbi:AAA family ATPase [Piscibacillus sp. B03]|uniref:AAA family ATPase n=1 Tax=Piscibacillus sp. B03 TaxID=3457430 RepID=UPI003FCDB335
MLLKRIEKSRNYKKQEFPFNLSLFIEFENINFHSPITLIVGENGTGKSTLLELIAYHAELIQINGEHMDLDDRFNSVKELTPYFKLIWNYKNKSGFFFQAESLTSFMDDIKHRREDLERDYNEIKRRDPNSLEILPYARNLHDLKQLYGDGLETQSHGESFLSLFQARFRPNSLYVLDEPESPLSPIKQLSLISMIKDGGCRMSIYYCNAFTYVNGFTWGRYF